MHKRKRRAFIYISAVISVLMAVCVTAVFLFQNQTGEAITTEKEESSPPQRTEESYAAISTSCVPLIKHNNVFVNTPVPNITEPPQAVPTPTEAPTPTPRIRKEDSPKYFAPEGVYTVGWISDTQHYANTFPEIYPTITSFFHDHAEELNLAYVVHTGDLVHQVGSKENWTRAVQAMSILGDIPYGVLAGNHDVKKKGDFFGPYCEYFGEQVFAQRPWYGGSFENNRGHFDLITIGNTDYIFVYMSFQPDEAALRFIKESFDRYPDRIGILCLHDFIKTDGSISADGKIIREKILSLCPNCYLVLCGHRYGFYCLEDSFRDSSEKERIVYEMMMNYQAAGKEGGSGYFRLMQFDEIAGTIKVLSYSAYLDDYNWLDDPGNREPRYSMDATSEEFELKMPWRD